MQCNMQRAVVCYGCVALVNKLGLDDALDVWGVHGMGGFLGTILLGALAEHDVNGVSGSFALVGKQAAAASLSVSNPTTGFGYPKNSSKISTAVKSNSFPTILGPFVFAPRVLDD